MALLRKWCGSFWFPLWSLPAASGRPSPFRQRGGALRTNCGLQTTRRSQRAPALGPPSSSPRQVHLPGPRPHPLTARQAAHQATCPLGKPATTRPGERGPLVAGSLGRGVYPHRPDRGPDAHEASPAPPPPAPLCRGSILHLRAPRWVFQGHISKEGSRGVKRGRGTAHRAVPGAASWTPSTATGPRTRGRKPGSPVRRPTRPTPSPGFSRACSTSPEPLGGKQPDFTGGEGVGGVRSRHRKQSLTRKRWWYRALLAVVAAVATLEVVAALG